MAAVVLHVQPVRSQRQPVSGIGASSVGEFHPGAGPLGKREPWGAAPAGDDGRGQQACGPALPVLLEGGAGVAHVDSQGGEYVAQGGRGDRGPVAPPVHVTCRDAVFLGQSDQLSIAHTTR